MFIPISNGVMLLPKLPKRKAMNVNLKKLWGVAPCHSTHGAFMLQQCPPKQWNHGVQGINCWGYHHFSKLPQPTFHLPQKDSHPKLCVGIKPAQIFLCERTAPSCSFKLSSFHHKSTKLTKQKSHLCTGPISSSTNLPSKKKVSPPKESPTYLPTTTYNQPSQQPTTKPRISNPGPGDFCWNFPRLWGRDD